MSNDHDRVFALIGEAIDATPGATLREIAARLRIHPQTVAGIIRHVTGLNAEVWRQRRVAARAGRALGDHPEMSIKEVAALCSLTTNGLRRLLVRQYGLTPTQMRSRVRDR